MLISDVIIRPEEFVDFRMSKNYMNPDGAPFPIFRAATKYTHNIVPTYGYSTVHI